MKIKGIGLPFSIHQSSCSNRTPKEFTWTTDDADIEVWMDYHIMEAINTPVMYGKKRYAWFCESRAIVPYLQQAFNHEQLFPAIVNSYHAIFTCDKELVDRHEKIHFCFAGSNLPWIDDFNYIAPTKVMGVSFISSSKNMCEGHKKRHQLFEKIKERTNNELAIDVYGSIIGTSFGAKTGCNLEGYTGNVWHDKTEALNDYMFSIVMENDSYDTYFTEKITDCFATGTVPIYYGSKSIGDYFNRDGIIFLDGDVDKMYNIISQLSPSMYYNRIDAIKDNMERIKNMQMADDMLYSNIKEMNNDTCNSI